MIIHMENHQTSLLRKRHCEKLSLFRRRKKEVNMGRIRIFGGLLLLMLVSICDSEAKKKAKPTPNLEAESNASAPQGSTSPVGEQTVGETPPGINPNQLSTNENPAAQGSNLNQTEASVSQTETINAGQTETKNAGETVSTNIGETGKATTGQTGTTNTSQKVTTNTGQTGSTNTGQIGTTNTGQTGTMNTSQTGTTNTSQPGTTNTGQSGTTNTGQIGTTNTGQTGTTNTSQSGTTNTGQIGTTNAGQTGTVNSSQPGTTNTGQTGTTNTSQKGTTNTGQTGTANTGQTGAKSNQIGATENQNEAATDGLPKTSSQTGTTTGQVGTSNAALNKATTPIATIESQKTDEEIEARWSQPNDAQIEAGGKIPVLRLGNTNYTIFRKRVNWFRAHDLCRKEKKILATFPTPESFDIIAQRIFDISVIDPYETNEFLGARRYWFGLNDLAGEGEWRWMDTGERLTYMDKFYPGQPDHIEQPSTLMHYVKLEGKTPSHCGLIWNPKFELGDKHVWDDAPCTSTQEGSYHYFICENY